jgi:hypothetical protein
MAGLPTPVQLEHLAGTDFYGRAHADNSVGVRERHSSKLNVNH